MASALQRYQLYVSHVGEATRSFLASLDAQSEEDVRTLLDQKGFGHRMYLARIWMDFRKKIRQELDDEAYLHRVNRSIETGVQVTDIPEAEAASVNTGPMPRHFLAAFFDRLRSK